MNYKVDNMTEQIAKEILGWRYSPPYDLYNGEINEEGLKEFMENPYYAIYNEESLVGFYCLGYVAQVPIGYLFGAYPEGYLDIGLGMKPALTGKGNGKDFLAFIINRLDQQEDVEPWRLTVAAFNKRAIALYEKFGFQKVAAFTNPNEMVFWVMTRER